METSRGDAAAATWLFRGDESRRRRGRDVDIPRSKESTGARLRYDDDDDDGSGDYYYDEAGGPTAAPSVAVAVVVEYTVIAESEDAAAEIQDTVAETTTDAVTDAVVSAAEDVAPRALEAFTKVTTTAVSPAVALANPPSAREEEEPVETAGWGDGGDAIILGVVFGVFFGGFCFCLGACWFARQMARPDPVVIAKHAVEEEDALVVALDQVEIGDPDWALGAHTKPHEPHPDWDHPALPPTPKKAALVPTPKKAALVPQE